MGQSCSSSKVEEALGRVSSSWEGREETDLRKRLVHFKLFQVSSTRTEYGTTKMKGYIGYYVRCVEM